MSLVLLYLGGAVVDGLVRLARLLIRLGLLVGLVALAALLDGCGSEIAVEARAIGWGVGLVLVAGLLLAAALLPKFRGRLLAVAAGLGGLLMLVGFLGLGRKGRERATEARRDAVTGKREQKKADKAEKIEVGKIEESMEKAAGQAELGSDDDLGELLELGARRRRERGVGKPPTGGAA